MYNDIKTNISGVQADFKHPQIARIQNPANQKMPYRITFLLCCSIIFFLVGFGGGYYIEQNYYHEDDAALFWLVSSILGLLTLHLADSYARKTFQFESIGHFKKMLVVAWLVFGGWLANNTWYHYNTFSPLVIKEYNLFKSNEHPNHFVFNGVLEVGAGSFITRAILNSKTLDMDLPISLEMHSDGGKASEAIILGEFIKEYDVAIEVLGKCVSTCSMVLLSSNHRYVHPKAWVGFHATYNFDNQQNVNYDANSLKFYDNHLVKLLRDVGASDAFIEQALVEDASGGFFPSFEKLQEAGIVNKQERTHLNDYDVPSYL